MTGYVTGLPGPRAAYPILSKSVMNSDFTSFLPGGGRIDGALTRDVTNTLRPTLLNPGLLMGQVTATKRWANSILGISANAYTSGGTSITVSVAQATEIVRRVGATGNLLYVGPPAASGTVAVLGPIAYSAIVPATGVITTATLGANLIAGGYVISTDGSGVPKSFIFDGTGLDLASDIAAVPAVCEWPKIPVAGQVNASKLLYWPTDTSLRAWVMAQLSTIPGGKFVFDANYQ